MTANIPDDILNKYKGFGFYTLDNEWIPIPEYAIPMEEFSQEFIVNIADSPRAFYTRESENKEYIKYIDFVKK